MTSGEREGVIFVARMSEEARRLADEAARRGWQYPLAARDLQLPTRWKWGVRFDHPFHGTGPSRYDVIGDVVSGATPAGRPFWAFPFVYMTLLGAPPSALRSVAFVYAGVSLPTVSVVSRTLHAGTSRVGMFGPTVSGIEHRAGQSASRRAGGPTKASTRLDGWPVGSEEFLGQYKVEADDPRAAAWLVGSDTQQALLLDSGISIGSNSGDILAWCEHGYLSIETVDQLIGLLDTVALPR